MPGPSPVQSSADAASAVNSAASVRRDAARVVAAVIGGKSLDEVLPRFTASCCDPPLLKLLSYGTLRLFPRLDCVLSMLLDRPLRGRDHGVRALALVGLYQLADMDVAPHAAVAETVEAAKLLGRKHAVALLNAVLRRFQREHEELLARAEDVEAACHAHPAWLIDSIRMDWPEEWQAVLAAGNRPPPMWLRVNRRRASVAEYARLLEARGLQAQRTRAAADALRLEHPVAVAALPGFEDGLVSVQDAGAQLACSLIVPAPGARVLDACAAPGGKTCHVLERHPEIGELVALDRSEARLARLRENLGRLRLGATLRVADATDVADWWDGRPFDRILIDAPCSATGVIRRHPDIKLLRRPADVPGFVLRQQSLLESLWPLLARGGRLIYATCSVLRSENVGVVEQFLERHRQAGTVTGFNRDRPVPGDRTRAAAWGRKSGPGVQVLPGEADMDGFYYACFENT